MGFGFIKKPFKAVGKAISSVGSGVKTITKDTWDGITDIGSAIVDPIQGLGAGTGELARENPTLALGALTGNPALTAAAPWRPKKVVPIHPAKCGARITAISAKAVVQRRRLLPLLISFSILFIEPWKASLHPCIFE